MFSQPPPSERMHELSGVLHLVKAEQAKSLHMNEEDVCVYYYRRKMDKFWSGNYTHRIYSVLSFDGTSILVQARTEHFGWKACPSRMKLEDIPICDCGLKAWQASYCVFVGLFHWRQRILVLLISILPSIQDSGEISRVLNIRCAIYSLLIL
jgi:hypothetical protein